MPTCPGKEVCNKTYISNMCNDCYREVLRTEGQEGILKREIEETEADIKNAEEKLKTNMTYHQKQDWEYLCYDKLASKLKFLTKQLRSST